MMDEAAGPQPPAGDGGADDRAHPSDPFAPLPTRRLRRFGSLRGGAEPEDPAAGGGAAPTAGGAPDEPPD